VIIAICDDERSQLDILERAARGCAVPGWRMERAERFASGEALLDAVANGEEDFDFIFLDIQMPGLGGLWTYQRLPEDAMPRVIFVSTHIEMMPEVHLLRQPYILFKPYTQDTFDRTIRSVLIRLDEHIFSFEEDGEIPCSGIRYIRSEGHYLKIFAGKETGYCRLGLDDAEKELAPHGFFRVHRSHLVNLRFFRRRDARSVYLKGGGNDDIEIPLGKSRARAFDDAVLRYKTERM
jgi:DNA-binding LytR/AlgR family response regulator